ncbi:MAG TPA: glycogen debranching enzyme GlgX [Pasteurellaceae bacterium]|nr:glycogen debranching enzyme GlgX [Pasteurellaceae bacterium]
MTTIIKSGHPYPLGFSHQILDQRQGVNFALFSAQADQIELCLFDNKGKNERRFPMQRSEGDIWHCWIADVTNGTQYGYRIYNKNDDILSNPNKLMLDPYAKAVIGKPDLSTEKQCAWFLLSDARDNAHLAPKAVVIDEHFDWEDECLPQTSWAETIIYEVHVKGFTKLREDLPEKMRGTYTSLATPTMIAYLQELGITAVELLPINYSLDEMHLQQKGLSNYWGYNPLAMFAVESEYAMTDNPLCEFKSMVKALHKAGIEVILDVVFNHTAESEKYFPTFSQRGIDNQTYYWQNEQGDYLNWAGCGNLLNLSSSHTRRWVIDCLRYWAEECHVDGFRFDLATVLGRESPDYNPHAQLFADIANEPSLQKCKFIAEPWDIGHFGYQLGNFPSYFAEWNDRFRDDMCRFWIWKSGELGAFAERFAGSSDIFKKGERSPHTTINFITAHDGFTLRDLVSYNSKHNEANGEQNRDGRNENYSYNHGIEGNTAGLPEHEKSAVEKSRFLTSSALLSSLLLSNGTPMLLAGDEFGNTQYGNNNAYCQDNEITWLKWREFDQKLFYNVKQTIASRKKINNLTNNQWWTDENVQWLTADGEPMNTGDWYNREIKALQILLNAQWLLLINAKAEKQIFSLLQGKWYMSSDIIGSSNQTLENQLEINDLSLCLLRRC